MNRYWVKWIFRKKFIDRFSGKLINGHGTRLPQNRGGGGFSWQILVENRLGGSLVHQVDTGIDTGAIVDFREYVFPRSCRIPLDYNRFSYQMNKIFFQDFFQAVQDNKDFELTTQQEIGSSYWPRLSTINQGFIDWDWSLEQIDRFICAFDDPYIGATSFIKGDRVFLKKSLIGYQDGNFHPFQTGIIYRKTDQRLFIATENGALIVEHVADEQGCDMIKKIRVGDRFYTPREHLEAARCYRPTYNAQGLQK